MAKSPAFRTWLRRLESGTFTAAQCSAWCKTVNPTAAGAIRDRWDRPSTLTRPEAIELRGMMRRRGGVSLERDHSEYGRAWMLKRGNVERFPAWCREGFERFSFQGEGIDIGTDYVSHYVPVWRVHGTAGETLDYYAAAWQSGRDVGPRILREGPRALERAQ